MKVSHVQNSKYVVQIGNLCGKLAPKAAAALRVLLSHSRGGTGQSLRLTQTGVSEGCRREVGSKEPCLSHFGCWVEGNKSPPPSNS